MKKATTIIRALLLSVTLFVVTACGAGTDPGAGDIMTHPSPECQLCDSCEIDWSELEDLYERIYGSENRDGKRTTPCDENTLARYGKVETLVRSVDTPTAADPKAVTQTSYGVLDCSTAAQGYVSFTAKGSGLCFCLQGPTRACAAVSVAKGETVKVALTNGPGKYQYHIGRLTSDGGSAVILCKKTFQVKAIDSDLAPYLVSTPYGDYGNAPETVKKAAELWNSEDSCLGNAKTLTAWVYRNLKYSKSLQNGCSVNTYDNPDAVMKTGGGVCGEFSKLLTAMLRSQGIPAYVQTGKLSNGIGHAWVVAWIESSSAAKDGKTCSTGAWVILDPTSGRVYDLTTMDNGAYKITTGDYCN